MAEIRTVTSLRSKKEGKLLHPLSKHEKRLAQAQSDLAQINAAIAIFDSPAHVLVAFTPP